jgi:flagellar biosynthesis protein FliR
MAARLLFAVILSILLATIVDALSAAEAKDLAQTLLTPLFALVGSVVGFYFGRSQ